MKVTQSLSVAMSVIGVFALSSCAVNSSQDKLDKIKKEADENRQKSDELISALEESFKSGGQPGAIKLSGVIVKDNSATDSRISVVSQAGIGKSGTRAQIADANKPVFSAHKEKLDLSKLNDRKDLVALGCDEKTIAELARDRTLEVQKAPAPVSEGVLIIMAKTIVVCGKIENVSNNAVAGQFTTLTADELILNNVTYNLVGMTGSISLNANKLVLNGASQISASGVGSSMTMSLAPSLDINILKEISSDDHGKLLIMSSGSDYVATAK